MKSGTLVRIRESIAYLDSVIESQLGPQPPGMERILDAYAETRRSLSRLFMELSQEHFSADDLLPLTKSTIELRMQEKYKDLIPKKYLHVSGYGTTHSYLLGFLARRCELPTSSSVLRILTGDQIHTERRVRELRDLGFSINCKKVSGENQYLLESLEPDISFATDYQAKKNIKADRSIDASARDALLERTGLK